MTREFSKEPPPGHARWQKVGESVYSPYTNTERKVVYIDPCECIKKYYEAAKKAKNSPPPTNDFTGEKAAARTRVIRSFNRFHADVMAYEYGKTSEAIYYNHRPGRWLIATDEQLKDYGFTGKYDLELWNKSASGEREQSDFKAQVYVPNKQLFCEDMPAVLVFKGTTPSSWEDWFNNLQQGMDIHSAYYDKAVRMAIKKLTRAKKPIVIAGHSLGGGLASACSGACGKDAWTFNAAGLHPNTVTRYKATPRLSKIEAYRHEGDILTALQEPDWKGKIARTAGPVVAGAALGGVGVLIGGVVAYKAGQMPAAAGSKHDIPCCNPELSAMARHEMGNTLESMNKMLLDMEDDLRKQTGVKCDQPVIA